LLLTERLLADILVEFPRFRLVPKSGDRLSRLIDRCLRVITLGLQDRYLTEYHTVIGQTLYVAPVWDEMDDRSRYILLCHERVHLRQRHRYGTLGMAFLYLLPILPLGLALGRARMEWAAYKETLRATAEQYGMAALEGSALRAELVERFTGPDYGWMWPFPRTIAQWYDSAVEDLRRRPAAWSNGRVPRSEGKTEES
jgi:hypothetical protein